jgi:hypothetical protein
LNLRNLFNKKYFDGTDFYYNAANRLNLLPAQPFAATATVKLEFTDDPAVLGLGSSLGRTGDGRVLDRRQAHRQPARVLSRA